MTKWKTFFIILFLLLVLPNLGTRPLWQDEAETALVARQMVRTPLDGVNSNVWLPYAWDDQGPISQDWNYQFSVSPLWRWHPWLQFYVTALSFKLLGISALSARLPFALIGIISYWYFLNFLSKNLEGWQSWGGPREGAPCGCSRGVTIDRTPTKIAVFFFTAATLFIFSTPLLLHLRQARYYSLSLFFTLMTIDGYLDLMKRRVLGVRQGLSLKYIIGSIFLFHSLLPAALVLQASIFLDLFISSMIRKSVSLKSLFQISISFSISLLFTLPWAIWLKIGGQNLNFSPELIKQHIFQHYSYIHKFIFPALILLPLISPDLRKKFFRDDKLVFFSISISISLLLYTFNHPYFFRYLIPLIPLFIYIAAWIITNAKPIWSLIPLISLILMTAKTFPKYLVEITHPYQNANAEIMSFLSSLDPEKYQKLAVNYDDFTFRFHTSFIVYGAQYLSFLSWPEDDVFDPPTGEAGTINDSRGEGGFFRGNWPSVTPNPRVSSDSRIGRPLSEILRRATRERTSPKPPPKFVCPDVIIIFPDWGNEEKLREISQKCKLDSHPLSVHYAKLADDPDPTNHRFTPPPLRTLEAFLAPPFPS